MNELFKTQDTRNLYRLCALDLRSVKYCNGEDEDLTPGMRINYDTKTQQGFSSWEIKYHSPAGHDDHKYSLSRQGHIAGRMYPLDTRNFYPTLNSLDYLSMARDHVQQSKGEILNVSGFFNPNLFGFLLMRSLDHKHMTGDKIKIQEIPLGLLNHVGITSHTELHEMINQTKNAVENLFNTIN